MAVKPETTRRKIPTDEEVETFMVPRIVEAIYPVLIPVEEQSMQIQAENHKKITLLALDLWRAFRGEKA